jgi:hypothetical protein
MGLSLKSDDHRWLEYAILVMLRAQPRAAFEVARSYAAIRHLLDWPDVDPRSIGRRMSELKARGYIVPSGIRAIRPDGRTAEVMEVAFGVVIEERRYR